MHVPINQKTHFYCKKRFGQNFLVDEAVINNIVKVINANKQQNLIEIGPGLGAITKILLNNCAKIVAIEIDQELIEQLTKNFYKALQDNKLILLNQDVLKVDFINLFDQYLNNSNGLAESNQINNKPRIVGNLPYNISTPLLFKLFGLASKVKDLHFLLQKEVALRLVATPKSKQYGRLSVMAQYHANIEIIFFVDAKSFEPVPKVESAMVRFVPHEKLPIVAQDYQHFYKLVTNAFSQKRKILLNALKKHCSKEVLESLGINPMVRPEEVSVVDFVRISNFLIENSNNH